MALPQVSIGAVPQESAALGADYPSLSAINVTDLVGPSAANRQPTALRTRDNTVRDRVNRLVENMNYISTGGPGAGMLYLPRDGSLGMTGNLNITRAGAEAQIVLTSTTADAYLHVAAPTGFGGGMKFFVNSVLMGYVIGAESGAAGKIDIAATDGTATEVVLHPGTSEYRFLKTQAYWDVDGAVYDFQKTYATFPGAVRIPQDSVLSLDGATGSNTIRHSSGDNYTYIDVEERLYIRTAGPVTRFLVTDGGNISYTNLRLDGTNRLYFNNNLTEYLYADASGNLNYYANVVHWFYVGGANKFKITTTQCQFLQDVLMDQTKVIYLYDINAYLRASSSGNAELAASTTVSLKVGAAAKLTAAATLTTSYQNIRFDGTARAEFGNASVYIGQDGSDNLSIASTVSIGLSVGGTKFLVGTALNTSYQTLRMDSTTKIEFNSASNYMQAIDADTVVVNAAADVILRVGGTGILQVTSTVINAYTHRIENVVDPSNLQDAATKNYVDNSHSGWRLKTPTNQIHALTVGEENCDYTSLESAIDYINGQGESDWVIYLFYSSNTGGYHSITTSKDLSTRSISIVGMYGHWGSTTYGNLRVIGSDVLLTVGSHTRWENIHFTCSGSWTSADGPIVGASNLTNMFFINCYLDLQGAGGTDVLYQMSFVLDSTATGDDNLVFENCYINFNASRYGMKVQYDRLRMQGCTVRGGERTLYIQGSEGTKISQCHFTLTTTVSTFLYMSVLYDSIVSDVRLDRTTGSATQGLYVNVQSCRFSNIHIELGAFASSGSYGLTVSGSSSTFVGIHVHYGQLLFAASTSTLSSSVVYCTDSGSTMGAILLDAEHIIVADCHVYRNNAGYGIQALSSSADYCSVKCCDVQATTGYASIYGVTGADFWHVLGNMVDVATAANGGASWTVSEEKVV